MFLVYIRNPNAAFISIDDFCFIVIIMILKDVKEGVPWP